MKKGRATLLGACVALPVAALAAPGLAAQQGCWTVPANGSAVFLREAAPTTAAEQVQANRIIAQANAMFRRMGAEMNAMQAQMAALMAMPPSAPQQMIQASFGPDGWTAIGPGTSTVITEVSTGSGTCSQTITYNYPARGRPIVHVAQSGNACGAIHLGAPGTVRTAQPVVPHAVPRTAPTVTRPPLIEASYHVPGDPRS
jgi:hypothetical protein